MSLLHFARAALVPALLLLVSGCRREPERLDPVPAALEGRVAVARAAAADLKRTLGQRLKAVIKKEGAERAVEVCATEASKLTGEVAARHGVQLGRSSSRLRSPRNAPRPWVRAYLDAAAGKRVRELSAGVYDLGDKVGVVLPIATEGLCLSCHGKKESLSEGVRAALAQHYPRDTATGFEMGQLRGVVWVELDKN